ncbi:hypothetical protein BESB_085630 [Besnoitia besnoiti]|uniref:Uncharacterized protein n=1 Tax=Besnoitia besnoiti TaxID=94643 RepID=A0A2A9M879_BESBE|nr:hypothetical protein BESB_085630 [Besnoitia besnoiti]PFH33364.1 hypothetical protein BESB_085630 [Besnoitia besnoiti]
MKNPENARVLKKFALFAVLVAALPISTVLFLPGFVVGILQILQPESSKDWLEDTAKLCGAIVSVVLVNVVMLLYAALAYQEEKADWETVTRAQASRPGPEQKSSAASGTKKSN